MFWSVKPIKSSILGVLPTPKITKNEEERLMFKKWNLSVFTILMAGLLLVGVAFCPSGTVRAASTVSENWVGTWSTSPISFVNAGISNEGFNNTTLRQIIYPHIDGSKIRIKLSNLYGIKAVTFNSVHVALQNEGASILPGTDRKVTFKSGQSTVTILPGAEVWSDPVNLQIHDCHNLAVSLYIAGVSGPATWHTMALQKNYISNSGDHTADLQANAYDKTTTSWFWLTGVEVVADETVKGALVILGDSISDGNNSTIDANQRWPDYLARRIRKESPQYQLAVLNQGISGNRLLTDVSGCGLKTPDRLEHDVLQQNKLKAVVLLIGINDIGNGCHDSDKLITAMKEIITRVHAKGARIYGGTITPYAVRANRPGYFTPEGELTRQSVNNWIRTSCAFDGVIDFDQALRDPNNPLTMLSLYDSGDHLHPKDAGYEVMANAVDLGILKGE
jgi:lysophospholipase L1-like esterase